MKYLVIPIVVLTIITFHFTRVENNTADSIDNIEYLNFHYTTGNAYNANVLYTLECNDICNITIKGDNIPEEDAKIVEVPYDNIQKVEDILNKYDVINWNGFNKSDSRVLDGNSFSFYVKFGDGKSISASGYMMYPKNYRDVKEELNSFFDAY